MVLRLPRNSHWIFMLKKEQDLYSFGTCTVTILLLYSHTFTNLTESNQRYEYGELIKSVLFKDTIQQR